MALWGCARVLLELAAVWKGAAIAQAARAAKIVKKVAFIFASVRGAGLGVFVLECWEVESECEVTCCFE